MARPIRPFVAAAFLAAFLAVVAPAASALQSFAYVANRSDNSVSVLNLATETVVETIDVQGSSPWSVATHPDGSRVYVDTSGWIRVIDTATNTVVDQINLDSNWRHDLVLSPDGSMLYAEGEGDFFQWEISAIDTQTNEVVASSFSYSFSDQISVSPDGSKVYETGNQSPEGGWLVVRDAQDLTVLDTVELDDYFYSVTAHPNGQWLFLGSHTDVLRIDTATFEIDWRKTVSWAGQFENLLISTDGERIYAPALGTGKTHVLETATGKDVGEIPLSGRGIGQHPLGHLIYITLQLNDRVAIVDAGSLAVLDVVPVGDSPVSAGADFVTPILCGPTLYGIDGDNGVSLTASGDGAIGSTLDLGYAQPPADSSYAFSYVALGSDAAPFQGQTLLLDADQLLFPTPGVVFSSAGQVLGESLTIPADPALVHLDVFLQAAFVELAEPFPVSLSNGVSLTICEP